MSITRKKIQKTAFIFLQFIRRDLYVYRRQLRTLVINQFIIYPSIYTISFAYVQSRAYFGDNTITRTVLFSGNILILTLITSFTLAFAILYDMEGDRHIEYLITLLSPRLILIERIIFDSLFCFFLLIPFYPMCKLLLGEQFHTSNCSWTMLFIIILAASFCCTAYHTLAACSLKMNQIEKFWIRFNAPLDTFGGAWAPLSAMNAFIPFLGTLALANPFIYITEGARSAILGTAEFIPASTCIIALMLFTLLFTLCSFHFFKKRLDCI